MPNYFDAYVFCNLFCQWLLTSNQHLNHPFLIDVIFIFSRVSRLIDWCTCSMYTAHLILLGVIFRATKGLYNMNDLFVIFKCLQTSLTHVYGLSLIVTTYNSTPLKAKGMTRHLICFSVKKKFSCSGHKRHEKISFPYFFCLFFLILRNIPVPPS